MLNTILTAVLLVVVAATLTLVLVERRRARQSHRRNGHHEFVAWDWPPRPVNGHDHPEPPELEREPA